MQRLHPTKIDVGVENVDVMMSSSVVLTSSVVLVASVVVVSKLSIVLASVAPVSVILTVSVLFVQSSDSGVAVVVVDVNAGLNVGSHVTSVKYPDWHVFSVVSWQQMSGCMDRHICAVTLGN